MVTKSNMKKVILNQKSYFLYGDMLKFKNEFDNIKPNNYEFILFPPILYLTLFIDSKYKIGCQNFYSYNLGSYTGEINLESLKNIGIKYSMIGHYERRKFIGELYSTSKEKLYKSLNAKFNTILCVGELKKTKRPYSYIKKELSFYLKNIESDNIKYLSIVYEPNWAIGSGKIQCIDKITKIVTQIKNFVYKKYGVDIDVYYGGSIDKNNIKQILEVCDGIMLGKVSTDIKSLKVILDEIE